MHQLYNALYNIDIKYVYIISQVYDRLQPLGVLLSHAGMLETMSAISGTFSSKLVSSVQEGRKFRIVGDNINFGVGVAH
jgi:hypothetical protein